MNQPLSGPGAYTPVPPLRTDDAHKAALTVCSLVRDTSDARLLLDALGITDVLRTARAAA